MHSPRAKAVIGGKAGTQRPHVRNVPRWALGWPDHRNGSVPQQVLDRAVIAALYEGPGLQLPDGGRGTVPAARASARSVSRQAQEYPVMWYVGQTIDHGQDVVVMFEIDGPNGRQLVVGQATTSQVLQDQPAWSNASSPWALTEVPAPVSSTIQSSGSWPRREAWLCGVRHLLRSCSGAGQDRRPPGRVRRLRLADAPAIGARFRRARTWPPALAWFRRP